MTEHSQAYRKGWSDAENGVPLWVNECAQEYADGWRAYWLAATGSKKRDQIIYTFTVT